MEAAATDQAIEQEFQSLTRAILNRYHEEQVWSDKIRSASTYGSLLALGLNILIFILAIIVVEPYKRKRLAETFEKRIEELSLETKDLVNSLAVDINGHIDKQEALLSAFKLPDSPSQTRIINDSAPIQKTIFETIEKRELMAAGCGAAIAMFLGGLILSFTK
jgi:sensitive to high expression protein 9